LMIYSDSAWDPGITLGIKNIETPYGQLRVYPNPAKDYVVCVPTIINWGSARMEVFNVVGEKMNIESSLSNDKITLNTQTLASGFYVVRISDSTHSYSGKFLIAR